MLKWAEVYYRARSSPLLSNVFIDDLPRTPRSKNKGVGIGGDKINLLVCADDIVLISKSQHCRKSVSMRANGTAAATDILSRLKGAKLSTVHRVGADPCEEY